MKLLLATIFISTQLIAGECYTDSVGFTTCQIDKERVIITQDKQKTYTQQSSDGSKYQIREDSVGFTHINKIKEKNK